MAVITDAVYPVQSGIIRPKAGPFVDGNDNLYLVAEDANTADDLAVFKSTDGGSNWSRIDTVNQPSVADGLRDWAVSQSGTVLHIGASSDSFASGMDTVRRYTYYTFNTSDAGANPDTWQLSETVVTPLGVGQGIISLDVRSDGDVILWYAANEKVMGNDFARTAYAVREAGTWTSGNIVYGTGIGENASFPISSVIGTSDSIHVFFRDDSATPPFRMLTLDSAGNTSTPTAALGFTSTNQGGARPISWDNGGTQQILVQFFDEVLRLVEDVNGDVATEAGQTVVSPLVRGGAVARASDGEVYHVGPFSPGGGFTWVRQNSTEGDDADWGNQVTLNDTDEPDLDGNGTATTYTRGGTEVIGWTFLEDVSGDVHFGEFTVGGTTFQESVAGTITPAGAVSNQVFPAQYTRYHPDADIAANSWSTAPLWSKVDDDPTDSGSESDFITDIGGGTGCILGLPNVATPDTWIGWRVRVRARMSSTGSRFLTARLRRGSDQATLNVTSLATVDSTTWRWIEFPVVWQSSAFNDLIGASLLNDLAVEVDASSGTDDIDVAAVELLVPNLDSNPFGSAPGWGDVELPSWGRAGPYLIGGNYWALGHDSSSKIAWLFKGTAPSDGHDPADWEAIAPVAELATGVSANNTALGASNRAALTGLEMIENQSGELVVAATTDESANVRTSVIAIDPTTGTYGTTNHVATRTAIVPGQATSTPLGTRIEEQTDTVDELRLLAESDTTLRIRTPLVQGSGEPTITNDPATLFDLIAADGRNHVFYGKTEDDPTQGIRERTVLANDTMETEPSSDVTTEDHARTGKGAAYSNGTVWRVVAPFPQADGGGITAIAFDSADAPSESLETVTTRGAFDAAYELNVVAVPLGTGTSTRMVVLWIDAATDAIYGAFRNDGNSTWPSLGELVTGSAGRTRLSAAPVDADTAVILVDDGTNIEFYTLNFSFGTTFQESVSGTIAPSADIDALIGKILGGTQTPSGAVLRGTSKSLTGSVVSGGAIAKRTSKILQGASTLSGVVVNRLVNIIALAGSLGLVGTRVAKVPKTYQGDIVPTSQEAKKVGVVKTGSITPTSARTKLIRLTQTVLGSIVPSAATFLRTSTSRSGSITPAGNTLRKAQLTHQGSIEPNSSLLRKIGKLLTGQITPTSVVATVAAQTVALAGSIAPIGTLVKSVGTVLAGSITPTSLLTRSTAKVLEAIITPAAGLLSRTIRVKLLGGAITPIGTSSHEVLTGTHERSFAGTLTPVGDLLRETAHLLDAAIAPTGVITQTAQQLREGSITPTGSYGPATIGKTLVAAITPEGALSKLTSRLLVGSITPAANLIGKVVTTLGGALSSVGALALEVNPGGTSISLGGTLILSGEKLQKVGRVFEGVVDPASTVTKSTLKDFAGQIQSSGIVQEVRNRVILISGTITPVSEIVKSVTQSLAGSIVLASSITKGISVVFSSVVSFVGNRTSKLMRIFTGMLTPTSTTTVATNPIPPFVVAEVVLDETGIREANLDGSIRDVRIEEV